MSDWLHNLPVPWMALLIFGFTYLLTAAIYAGVARLAVGERAKSFKAISPGMLPPLGIIFGLFVAFTAAQVWSDNDRASAAVSREASALRSAMVLAGNFAGEPETRLRSLIHDYIEQAATMEWPMMACQTASLKATPGPLAEALQLVLSLTTTGPGQQTAQREITSALETALDARRQRIIVSRAEVNFVKWSCLYLQAVCALLAIALVHCEQPVGIYRCPGPVCDRRRRLGALDRGSRPAVYRTTLGHAGAAARHHAGCAGEVMSGIRAARRDNT